MPTGSKTRPDSRASVSDEPVVDAPAESDAPTEEEVEATDPRDERIADLEGKLARARADYENLRKRHEREAALERDRVKGRVLEDFLQVYEYGKMAEFEADRNPGPLAEGVKMIVRDFDRLLEAQGVTPIGTVGEAFDAGLHEAVGEEEGDVPPGAVSRVVQPGYQLGERVLRYAKVMVAPVTDAEE